jgi:hypothetical protein
MAQFRNFMELTQFKQLFFHYFSILLRRCCIFFFPLYLFACTGSSSETADTKKLIEKGRLNLSAPQLFALTDETKAEAIRLELNHTEGIVEFDKGRQRLIGQYTLPRQIKYFNRLADVVAWIQYTKEGFQLRNTNRDLLWQVRILADKIQISDNATNLNPFDIRLTEAGNFKVFGIDKLLGDVRLKQGRITAKGSKVFEVASKANHPAFGVLLIQAIPEELRLVIWMELLRW